MFSKIILEEPVFIKECNNEFINNFKTWRSFTYLSEERCYSVDKAKDYKIGRFYDIDDLTIDGYTKEVMASKALDRSKIEKFYKKGLRGFIKVPITDDRFYTLFNKLKERSDISSYDFPFALYSCVVSGSYNKPDYSLGEFIRGIIRSISSDSIKNNLKRYSYDGYFYLAYDVTNSSAIDDLLTLVNDCFDSNFDNEQELLASDDFGVSGYCFTDYNGNSSSSFSDYTSHYSIFGIYYNYGYQSGYGTSLYNITSIDDTSFKMDVYVPEFCLDYWVLEDGAFGNTYSKNVLTSVLTDDYFTPIHKYSADSYGKAKTLSELNLDSNSTLKGMNKIDDGQYESNSKYSLLTYSAESSYSNTYYSDNLSTIKNRPIIDISLLEKYSYSSYTKVDADVCYDKVKSVVDALEDIGCHIDYTKSYMPDFKSGTYDFKDYISISRLDNPSICVEDSSFVTYVTDGVYARKADSVSSTSHVKTLSDVSHDMIKVPISIFKPVNRVSLFGLSNTQNSSGIEKGDLQDILVQVVSKRDSQEKYSTKAHLSDVGDLVDSYASVKNASSANYARVYLEQMGSLVNLDNNSDVFNSTGDYWDKNIAYYVDYKFGNIIFASKPSAPLDLSLEGDKLTWVKPIDEGLGYTANNTRSRKMSIRSVSPSFTSKTDDVVHLESYTLEIKDSSDVVKYTQTLTDSGSGLEEEITIPSQYLTSEYTAYIYATNKIGASDSALINLGVPSAKVTVSTDKESYKVGDTITYTETIKNTSSSNDLTNVKVTQSLTGGTYEDQTGVTTTDNVATISTLGKGDSVTLTYKYVVPAGVVSGDIISNKVTVTSDEGVNTYIIKEVTVTDGIKDLSLDVTTDKSSYKPGDTVILKSSVKNTGEVDLTNVKITQQLDGEYIPKAGVTMLGKDASIPTLAVGETVEVEYKIIIPSNYNQTSISNKTDVTADGGVDKSVTKTITIVLPTPTNRPYQPPVYVPTPRPTEAPTAEPTKVPTEAPTQEPTQAPTEAPTEAPTQEPTQAPTPVPEYDFTIKDVYHNDDGTTEVKERENVRIKEGEPYSFSALDSEDYIPRVPKYEGIASKDTEIIFDYDEKEKRVTLQGYVTYSDGSPIKDKLIEVSGKEIKSDITDDTGFYRIDNILVGDYDYTLYNDVTTGSGILAKCGITVTKKSGTVEVKYNSDDCKVDYNTEDGVIRVNANIKKEEVATPSPVPTIEPTLAPTQEPTVAPTVEPTIKPTVKPTKKPTPVSTKKPTSTPKPTKKPAVVPIKVSTPEPTRKPTRVTYLAQTGIYDIKKVASAGVLILSGIGLVIIALRRRKK